MTRARVLFVAEAVTLAQVVRLRMLAGALDPERYDVHFASARFDPMMFDGARLTRWPIRSLSPEVVERAVAAGQRPWDEGTLMSYVADDERLIAAVRPDLIVGDLRLSLTVSAPRARVPHAALVNAYWSPLALAATGVPLPDHPILKWLGEESAERHFPRAVPFVFAHAARPVNELRTRHGLPPIGALPEVLTFGDATLFPDVPELVPLPDVPASQRFLGPVSWSAPAPLPSWWSALDPGRPTAYVTLGSSGRTDVLPLVLEQLAASGVQSLVATAGRARTGPLPPRAFVADFLPGDEVARRADFVVSNGGSTTGYQALLADRPVLGIASNLDQQLASGAIVRARAGLALRAGTLRAGPLRAAIDRLLSDDVLRAGAAAMGRVLRASDSGAHFRRFVEDELAGSEASRRSSSRLRSSPQR